MFSTTLDGLIGQFDRLQTKLDAHAANKQREAAEHYDSASYHLGKCDSAKAEAARASKISANVKSLIAA